jgi:hypothetical protein
MDRVQSHIAHFESHAPGGGLRVNAQQRFLIDEPPRTAARRAPPLVLSSSPAPCLPPAGSAPGHSHRVCCLFSVMLRRAGVAGVRAVSTLLRVAPPSWSGARSATAGLAAKACTSSALASVGARGFASSVVYPPACATIGQLAPSFSSDAVLPTGEISKLSLSDLKGQWVVLLFCASL